MTDLDPWEELQLLRAIERTNRDRKAIPSYLFAITHKGKAEVSVAFQQGDHRMMSRQEWNDLIKRQKAAHGNRAQAHLIEINLV